MQEKISILIKVEQTEEVEKLAGLNYTPEEIAMYLDVNKNEFLQEFNTANSRVKYHFERGKLIAKAEIDMQSLQSAKGGNITAAQRLDKIRDKANFEFLKQQIINGKTGRLQI